MDLCKICGEREEDHHIFWATVMPDGCVCNPNGWRDRDNIPEICDDYQGGSKLPEYCLNCNHDKECHEMEAVEKGE